MPRFRSAYFAGLLVSLTLHAGVLYGLRGLHTDIPVAPVQTLYVNMVTPPAAPKLPEPVKPEPARKVRVHSLTSARVIPPQSRVATAPVAADRPAEAAVMPQLAAVAHTAALDTPAVAKPAEPATLTSELALSCPERNAPRYPASSRRMGEQGRVMVRVELNEAGRVAEALVAASSGVPRLDEAALVAVKQWRCNPAQRDGRAVRAVAMQSFNFSLDMP